MNAVGIAPADSRAAQGARPRSLGAFFAPETVAIVGASEKPGSVGRALWENLREFDGRVFPINPNHKTVLSVPTFAQLADVPEKVDLALVATPAATVPGIIRECGAAGVKAAIIHSAGFKECGPAGSALEREVLTSARAGGVRIIGPNCLGLMAPHQRLNATFAASMARPGSVAFVSQSGALCTAVLDWSLRENVGFSAMVSVGSMLDVGWGELITSLGDDPCTRSILLYMESMGDARAFLSAAREVSCTKPIIAVKAGRTEAAAKAAASHTGALTGSDAVIDAAFRRAGVLRVDTIEDLFDLAEVLAKQPRPRGPRLGIVTNAGGPAALAVDHLVIGGGQVASLSEQTVAELNLVLPPQWSHGNPVDILGDADEHRYAKAVELVLKDPNTDGLLIVLTPQAMTNALATAQKVASLAAVAGEKPMLASWMGGPAVEAGDAVLNSVAIPTFGYPDRAAQTFNAMWRYSVNLKAAYETPTLPASGSGSDGSHQRTNAIIQAARQRRRVVLTQHESKTVLADYGLPVAMATPALNEAEAVAHAVRIGFPVVVKLHSETITHKSDVGGVRVNVRNAAEVREAWHGIRQAVLEKLGPQHFLGVTVERMVLADGFELILGSTVDEQFGPVILFGAGGRWVEVMKDCALGFPPLTSTLACRLMEQTRIYTALKGIRRRPPIDWAALEHILVRFSQLVAEQKWIKEMDINPLLVTPREIIALDARVILHAPDLSEAQLPTLALRPYPQHYTVSSELLDGTPVVIRSIRPEDQPMMVRFHGNLLDPRDGRCLAYLTSPERMTQDQCARLAFIDYDREVALIAVRKNPVASESEVIGVGRLSKVRGTTEAKLALVVADSWRRRGLGSLLLCKLVEIAREERVGQLRATGREENQAMRRLCERAGFQLRRGGRETVFEAILAP
ncbi:MAG TPA: GNAT family N-acetyltransferase [Opitutus sp.]|nr:GNAT family N-acetyltransferase [Opitutus sp.]